MATKHATLVAVLGAGPVGLCTGAGLAWLGHRVTLIEADPVRLAALKDGRIPFHEPGLPELMAKAVRARRLAFAGTANAAKSHAIAFVCVGTPPRPDGSADLSMVESASSQLAAVLPKGAVVVLRSTVPPGTADRIEALLRHAKRPDLEVVNAPEFLAEGTAVRDFQNPSRLVAGGSETGTRRVLDLFAKLPAKTPRIATDHRSAEVAKYAANTFLAARVSLINEVANLCDSVGADVRDVARIVGLDDRVGAKFLRPGIGYGGSCFPKDVQALQAVAKAAGTSLPVAAAVHAGNEAQWRRVTDGLLARLGPARGKRVAILGIAFKPGTDDTREAPGTKAMLHLRSTGLEVVAHDPLARLPPGLAAKGVRQVPTLAEAVAGADAVLLATEWPEFSKAPWAKLRKTMRGHLFVDGRNALADLDMPRLGFDYVGVGIPVVNT